MDQKASNALNILVHFKRNRNKSQKHTGLQKPSSSYFWLLNNNAVIKD